MVKSCHFGEFTTKKCNKTRILDIKPYILRINNAYIKIIHNTLLGNVTISNAGKRNKGSSVAR